MVFVPTRGDHTLRFGTDIPNTPFEPGTVPASWYTDPERFDLERKYVLNPSWQMMFRAEQVPNVGDHYVWEGQGETVVFTRRKDGTIAGFHNICQHRGSRIVRNSGCGARRFTCPFHDWVYDFDGKVIGVPDREDFDQGKLEGLRTPEVEVGEWGGWVWAVLDGPGVAPPLLDWLGADIIEDLGAYQMEHMFLKEKVVWDVDVNWKVIMDAFNEFYHAPALHHISPQDVKDGREMRIFEFDHHAMMIVPLKGALPKLKENPDHQSVAICHYTIFPSGVFNNNPEHLQLFRPVPLSHNKTRFETWELWYKSDDADYLDRTERHWEHLKVVVGEDVWTWEDIAATSRSMYYKENVYNDREGKIPFFHNQVNNLIEEGKRRDAAGK
jgi:phenylpropionate dioxygenase-like ring-hydroxylating dioxygenase large terminal subunit